MTSSQSSNTQLNCFAIHSIVTVILTLSARAVLAVTIPTVFVGNPGNANDTRYIDTPHPSGVGAVAYPFNMGRSEVTNAQYTAFLNAVAATDTYNLFPVPTGVSSWDGIVRSGSPGSYTYAVKSPAVGAGPGGLSDYVYDDKPVVDLGSGDAMRFANWLHNGQPTGPQNASTTEGGAYTLNGAMTDAALNAITRNSGARWWLPNDNEWHKAAYHKNDGVTGNYWDYPTGTNSIPNNNLPSSDTGNSVNHYIEHYGTTTGSWDYPLTDAYAYTLSDSPYGTLDQGGNVFEWTETPFDSTNRIVRGGTWESGSVFMFAGWWQIDHSSESYGHIIGFRVASAPNLPGDFNHDNTVDAADYVVWRQNPGGIYTPDDYTTWRANFGRSFFTGGATAAVASATSLSSAVPEPASAALALACLVFVCGLRPRKRNSKQQDSVQNGEWRNHVRLESLMYN